MYCGWNRGGTDIYFYIIQYRNKRQHRKFTLERKILPPLLLVLDPQLSQHWSCFSRVVLNPPTLLPESYIDRLFHIMPLGFATKIQQGERGERVCNCKQAVRVACFTCISVLLYVAQTVPVAYNMDSLNFNLFSASLLCYEE